MSRPPWLGSVGVDAGGRAWKKPDRSASKRTTPPGRWDSLRGRLARPLGMTLGLHATVISWRAKRRGEGGPVVLDPARLSPSVGELLTTAATAWTEVHGHGPPRKALAGALAMLRGTAVEIGAPELRRPALVLAAAAAVLGRSRVHLLAGTPDRAAVLHGHAAPLLAALHRDCALIRPETAVEARRAAYWAPLVVTTVCQLGADYLRDRYMAGPPTGPARLAVARLRGHGGVLGGRLVPGLGLALLDDLDRFLLDGAQAIGVQHPCEPEEDERLAAQAILLAGEMEREVHFRIDPVTGRVILTSAGQARLETLALVLGDPWTSRWWREETMQVALVVRYLLETGRDYRLEEGRVEISGLCCGRRQHMSPSLERLIGVKEQAPPSVRAGARIGCRALFGNYLQVSGACGDLRGLGAELWRIYRMPAARVAPLAHSRVELRLFVSERDLFEAVRAVAETAEQRGEATIGVVGNRALAPASGESVHEGPRGQGLSGAPRSLQVIGPDELPATRHALGDMPATWIVLGACPAREARRILADLPRGTAIRHFVSREDPYLGKAALRAPRRWRGRAARQWYAEALGRAERRQSVERWRLLRSDDHFQKMLSFTGGGPSC